MDNSKLNKILFYIVVGLLLALAIGTVIGLTSKNKSSSETLVAKGKAENLTPPVDTSLTTYFNLGTMRIMPKIDNSEDDSNTNLINSVMVITPWLEYPAGDTVFFEELARKQGAIKNIFSSSFSQKTKNQILSETEEKITKSLIKQINEILSLGKVSNIYFTDYLFLE